MHHFIKVRRYGRAAAQGVRPTSAFSNGMKE
jgi:hypothetical protein